MGKCINVKATKGMFTNPFYVILKKTENVVIIGDLNCDTMSDSDNISSFKPGDFANMHNSCHWVFYRCLFCFQAYQIKKTWTAS